MIPQHFVMLDVLPLLPNGKIDRKALPAPIAAERAHSAIKTESGGAKIDAVSAAFEKALNLPGVGPDDDFFSLGGHSLLAAQLVAGLSRQFGRQIPLRVVFEQPTVRGVAHWLDTQLAAAGPAMRITHVPGRSVAPLSLMQQRIWFLEQLQPGRSAYNVPSGHRLTGPLDPAAFAAALDALIRRQPALRTVIGVQDDEPVQRVVAPFSLPLLPPEDLSSLPAVERELRLAERLRELALQVFDLERGPLVTAHLFRLAPEEHVFFFMAHHLVWDGWSFDILYRDLGALYARAIDQSVPAPPELEVSYGDFAVWQRDFMRGDALQAQVEHWRGRLADAGAVLMLPEDSPRPLVQSGRGSSAWINLDRTSTAAVHDLARNSETTPFVVLLSAFVATLHALTGQRDFVVGSPLRGRSLPELESVMGFFVNALPIRIGLEPGASMAHLLQTTRTAVRDAFSHPDVPFEHLVRALDLPRDESRFPLYQSFFSYQDGRDRPRNWGPLQHRPNFVERAVATEDLGLWFLEREDGLRGGLIVNADILSAASAAHIGRLYAATLQRLMRHPGASLEQTIAATLEEVTAPVAWLAHRERVAAQQTTSPPPASRTPAQPPSGARRAPDTAAERVLASIWSELLGVEEISATDNFFDLGGHSLLAMKAIVEMDRRLGKRVNPRRYIFESLAQIAAAPDERPAPPRGVLGRVLSALRRDPAGRAADRERRG
jgi:acyl carrier protein